MLSIEELLESQNKGLIQMKKALIAENKKLTTAIKQRNKEITELKEENSKLRKINCNNQNVLLEMKQIVVLKDKVIELMAEEMDKQNLCVSVKTCIDYFIQQAKELMKENK